MLVTVLRWVELVAYSRKHGFAWRFTRDVLLSYIVPTFI